MPDARLQVRVPAAVATAFRTLADATDGGGAALIQALVDAAGTTATVRDGDVPSWLIEQATITVEIADESDEPVVEAAPAPPPAAPEALDEARRAGYEDGYDTGCRDTEDRVYDVQRELQMAVAWSGAAERRAQEAEERSRRDLRDAAFGAEVARTAGRRDLAEVLAVYDRQGRILPLLEAEIARRAEALVRRVWLLQGVPLGVTLRLAARALAGAPGADQPLPPVRTAGRTYTLADSQYIEAGRHSRARTVPLTAADLAAILGTIADGADTVAARAAPGAVLAATEDPDPAPVAPRAGAAPRLSPLRVAGR